ncbi:MAG: hypothetical protein J7M38_15440 [Armatimonadetes bacterium]|nr:hypothetical protein [Armatimonadota bacterium]
MLRRTVMLMTLITAVAGTAWAMDSLNMPIGNSLKPGQTEINFIYVNQPRKVSPTGEVKLDDLRFLKFFTGVTNRLQIDVDTLSIKDADEYWEINAYYTVLEERLDRPALIVGATNLTGEDWLGGSDFGGNPDNDDPSLFGLITYTFNRSPHPTPDNPVLRVHFGWGDNFHGDDFFGAMQFKFHPQVIGVAQNYKSMPTFFGTVRVTDTLQVTAGTMDGYPFYRAGGVVTW